MKNCLLRTTIVFGLGLCVSAGNLLGAIWFDDFSGTSLDTEKWIPGSYGSGTVAVNDGLYLSVAGGNHDASVYSVPGDFDFHAEALQYTVEIDSFANPELTNPTGDWGTISYQSFRLHTSIGPASNIPQHQSSDSSVSGFAFRIQWLSGDRLQFLPSNANMGWASQNLTAVPSSIVVDLDATNFSITLVGSTFVSSGTSVLSGTHTLPALSSYHLLTDLIEGNTSDPNMAVIGSISVVTVPEPATFALVLGFLGLGFVGRRFWFALPGFTAGSK